MFSIFRVLERLFDENGYCMPFSRAFKQAKVKPPQRIIWEVTPELETCINEAVIFSTKVCMKFNIFNLSLLLSIVLMFNFLKYLSVSKELYTCFLQITF